MRALPCLAAAFGAAALALASPAAAAVTLNFNVQVNSAVGDDAFTSFSFQETWSFEPTFSTSTSSIPGFGQYTVTRRFTGPATVTGSPLTPELKTLAGLMGVDPLTSTAAFTNRAVYSEADDALLSSANGGEFFQSIYASTLVSDGGTPGDVFDDVYEVRSYTRGLSLQAGGLYMPPSMDEAGLLSFLSSKGPLNWSETGGLFVGGVFESSPVLSDIRQAYYGTATLILGSAVPEPGTWALMILGFGGAGAALRRSRKAAVLA